MVVSDLILPLSCKLASPLRISHYLTSICLPGRTTEISLYIHQEHQRRGLGALMLKEMMRIGKEMKFRNLMAGITAENEGSVILFSKFGFKQVAHLHDVGYKFGRYLDVVFLEYLTDAEVKKGQAIPSFVPFAWDNYEYDGTCT